MKTGIYIVYDKLAQSPVGGLYLHRHDATAIRFFVDVLSDPNSQVGAHPDDFCLMHVGEIHGSDEPIKLTENIRTVLEGSTWASTKAAQEKNNS